MNLLVFAIGFALIFTVTQIVMITIDRKKKKKEEQAQEEEQLKQQNMKKYDVLVCFTDGNNAVYKDITHIKMCDEVMTYTLYQGIDVSALININEVRNIDTEARL